MPGMWPGAPSWTAAMTATEWATIASLATAVGTLVLAIAISVRNVGTGLAVMHGWHVEVTGQPQQTYPPLEEFTTQTRDIYLAPGDVGFWQRALRDPATAQLKAVAAAVEAGDPMMLNVLYGDWEGGQRVITQFALRAQATSG
jgi:hypothetical protein